MKLLDRIKNYLEEVYEKPKWYEWVPPFGIVYFHRQKDVFSRMKAKLIEDGKIEEVKNLNKIYHRATMPGFVLTSSLMVLTGLLFYMNYTKPCGLAALATALSYNYSEFLWGFATSKLIKNTEKYQQ